MQRTVVLDMWQQAYFRQNGFLLFENIFSPDNRKGIFQEPQAVEAANAFIFLVEKYFHINHIRLQ